MPGRRGRHLAAQAASGRGRGTPWPPIVRAVGWRWSSARRLPDLARAAGAYEAGDPQGQETDERRTPAEIVAVLAIERGRVARGLVRRCIALASAR